MRIAILSDIHGNSLALDAVLEDIQARGGADAYWVLGDLVAMGPDPVGCLERVNELPNALFVRGNTDRWVSDGMDARAAVETLKTQPDAAHTLVSLHASIGFAQGALAASGWTNWLASIGLDQRVTLPDGTGVLLVHASPGTDDGSGIHPGINDAALAAMLTDCDAALVCVGHTHWAIDRISGAMRVFNPGSISVPWGPDVSASYALLQAGDTAYSIEQRRVPYDASAVLAQFARLKHPGYGMIASRFLGEVAPPWAAALA
jgi:predicted phosphodiesterase